MVTKKQELKKLTWKYFWQQKFLELLIIPSVIGLGFLTALFGRWIDTIMAMEKCDRISERENTNCGALQNG